MQEELKNVLTLFRERRKNLDIVKTPEVFIQQTSNPAEVETWLTAKGFSERTVKKLHGLTGNELFALNRKTLEDYCGVEEGKRLASQITIQRNISGVSFVLRRSRFSLIIIDFAVQNSSLFGTFSDLGQSTTKERSVTRKFLTRSSHAMIVD